MHFWCHASYKFRPSQPLCLNHTNNMSFSWGVQIIKLHVFFHLAVTSCLAGPSFDLSTTFLNTLSIRSSLRKTVQVSHPYKQDEIIKVFRFLVWTCEDKNPELCCNNELALNFHYEHVWVCYCRSQVFKYSHIVKRLIV